MCSLDVPVYSSILSFEDKIAWVAIDITHSAIGGVQYRGILYLFNE